MSNDGRDCMFLCAGKQYLIDSGNLVIQEGDGRLGVHELGESGGSSHEAFDTTQILNMDQLRKLNLD
jgi:hypothetical protein